jgi:hypothetical protein
MRAMQPTDTTEPGAPSSPPWFDTRNVDDLDRDALIKLLALLRQIRTEPATFGGRIVAVLLARGTTQSALADETGISQPTISRWARAGAA